MTEEEMEKAIDRHSRRFKTFTDEGMCEGEAWRLADQMWDRDLDPQDDRRVCFECRNYVAKHCTQYRDKYNKPTMPLRFILQRCDKFELKGKR